MIIVSECCHSAVTDSKRCFKCGNTCKTIGVNKDHPLVGDEVSDYYSEIRKKKKPTGVELIAEERQRQIDVEGWTPEHDDQYQREELLDAARCYITAAQACEYSANNVTFKGGYRPNEGTPNQWPWMRLKSWKPSGDPVRDLQKAGALIAAEIDRLQRLLE